MVEHSPKILSNEEKATTTTTTTTTTRSSLVLNDLLTAASHIRTKPSQGHVAVSSALRGGYLEYYAVHSELKLTMFLAVTVS